MDRDLFCRCLCSFYFDHFDHLPPAVSNPYWSGITDHWILPFFCQVDKKAFDLFVSFLVLEFLRSGSLFCYKPTEEHLKVTKMSYIACGALKSIKKAKKTLEWHTMNTALFHIAGIEYWCAIIIDVEDSQSQMKIATHKNHEIWLSVPEEICLGIVFYFPPWKRTVDQMRNGGRCKPWAEECLIKQLISLV